MATVDRIEEARDYLGHPCNLAPALSRFREPLEEARKEDVRRLAQSIRRSLSALVDRCEQSHEVLELAESISDRTSDDVRLMALLAMASEHALETCNKAFELSGKVLDALERADFVRPSQQRKTAEPAQS